MQWRKTVMPAAMVMPLENTCGQTPEERAEKTKAAQNSKDPFVRVMGDNMKIPVGLTAYLLVLPKMRMFRLLENAAMVFRLMPNMPVYQLIFRIRFIDCAPIELTATINADNDDEAKDQAELKLKEWIDQFIADLNALDVGMATGDPEQTE